MSDVMLYGILSMPYEMAMSDELSRFQFYKTVQRLLEKDSQQQAEMDIVIKLLCGEQISDELMAYWNPLHSTLKSKLLKAQENERK